jgi:hypothetical protein
VRVIFATRDGVGGRYLADRLARADRLAGIVLESGAPARRAKLRRTFRSAAVWRWPARCVDLAALAAYGALCERQLRRRVGRPPLPGGVPRLAVDDINDAAVPDFLAAQRADLVVVYGTGLVRRRLLEAGPPIWNVHGGIVPRYRNVHCDAWALYHGDRDGLGVSLLRLDAGIDSGAVIAQARLDPELDGIFAVKAGLLATAAELLASQLRDGLPAGRPQPEAGERWPTPPAGVLLRLLWRAWRSG